MSRELIPIDTNLETMKLMLKLVTIAMKAHGFNASPVDIKNELAAETNHTQLGELSEVLNERINERETVFNGNGKSGSGVTECNH